jgi:hypothetical protein
MRFSTRLILTAVFALISFVAVAPAAHADGGQLDAVNYDFALSSFSTYGNHLDTTTQIGPGTIALLLDGSFGELKTLSILSGGVTYTFSDVKIQNWGFWWGQDGLNIDFTFKSESKSSSVPEPATVMLIGCGLFALALASSRKALRA